MALGLVVVDLFLTRAYKDSSDATIRERTQIDIQKNLRFDRNAIQELDSCDFQFYSDSPTEITPLDVVEIFVYNELPSGVRERVDYFSYVVNNINIENVDTEQTQWLNTINATECTKRLEGYSLTRDFSQPSERELETPSDELPPSFTPSEYEGYPNRLKMVEEAKQLCWFRKDSDLEIINVRPWDYIQGDPTLDPDYANGEDNTGTTYALLSEDLGTDSIAAVTASNDTLRDVLDEIFSSYNATTRLDYINGKFRLMADKQNEITSEVDISKNAKTFINRSINGYSTFANPELQNVIGQEILATNGVGGRPMVADSVFATSDSAKVFLEYPIKDIIKVEFARLNSTTWVDITNYVIKADQRRFLDSKQTAITNNDDLYLNNVCSYAEGSNEINGFGDEFEGVKIPFFGAAITTCWENIIVSSGATGTLSTDIREHRVRVQYRTLTSEKVHIFKNDFSEQKHLYGSPINVNAQTLDFKKAGIDLQDKVEKTGAETQDIDIILDTETLVKGDNYYDIKQLDSNTGKVIVKMDHTLLDGNLKTKYTLAKGGYLNAQVVVDSLKRASAIEDGLTREVIVNDFVNIDYEFSENGSSPSELSSLTIDGILKFADTFRTTNSIDASVDNAIFVSNELANVVSVSVSKHITKDYAKVGFKANNPVILGYRQDDANNKVGVRYALRNGTANDVGISFGESEITTSDETYNRYLPAILPSDDDPLTGTKLIDLGDTSGINEIVGDASTVNDDRESSNQNYSQTFTATPNDGEVLIPREFTYRIFAQSRDESGGNVVNVSINVQVYINGNKVGEYDNDARSGTSGSTSISGSVNLPYGRVGELRVVVSSSQDGRNDAINSSGHEYNLEYVRQKVEQCETGSKISVMKTPSEILGLSHALNVIKPNEIITGQAFMIRNSLYTNFNYDEIMVFASESENYYDGDETPKGQQQQWDIQVNSITTRSIYLSVGNGNQIQDYSSYAIFGRVNGKLELLIAMNSQDIGGKLLGQQHLIIFNFSSKPRGLIME